MEPTVREETVTLSQCNYTIDVHPRPCTVIEEAELAALRKLEDVARDFVERGERSNNYSHPFGVLEAALKELDKVREK